MASVTLTKDASAYAPIGSTFDITSVTPKHVGPYFNYYSFDTDGTMMAIHSAGGQIVGWDHYLGDGTILQTATANLPLQPFLDNMYSRNPSSVKAINYLFGGDDTIDGAARRDVLDGRGGNDTLTGHGGNDKMLGGAGDDVLNGGLGRDTAKGGLGADSFDFHAINEGGDTIADFEHGIDHVRLDAAFGFGAPLTDGVNFLSGAGMTAPADGNPALIYDTNTGALYHDADGNGAGAAQLIATFSNHAALSAADILLI